MTLRSRRLLIAGGAVVLLLFLGRGLAVFLTDRWWAASISDAARDEVTRWALLGWLLDAVAITLASAWFIGHAAWVVRGVAALNSSELRNNEAVPVALPQRILTWWAIAVGGLLGLLTGSGAHAWRAPMALAREGVRFGEIEPLSGADLGTFVADLPLWRIGYDFFSTLVLLTLALVTVLYLGTGGLRREQGRVIIHPHSRRHLGGLLVLLALLVMVGALLHPWTIVAGLTEPLPMAAVAMRGVAAQAMIGVALAVAVMSFSWALRGRNTMLVSGWAVLGIALVIERGLIPALTTPTAPIASADADIRRADARAWGFKVIAGAPSRDTLPSATGRWEPATLARVVEGQGGTLLNATAGRATIGDSVVPLWYLTMGRPDSGSGFDVVTLRESAAPLRDTAAVIARIRVEEARLRPDAPAWRQVTTGVASGGMLRRVVLAWGRQAGGLLRHSPTGAVDWNLDPTARAAAIVPTVSWLPADLVVVGGRPLWIVQGMIPMADYPLATRERWGGREVAGVMPALVAVMDPRSGSVTLHRDPAADSLGAAWARILGPLVAPEGSLSPEIRAGLRYSRLLFELQLRILEGSAWHLGRRPGRRVADGPPEPPVPVWTIPDGPGWQSVLEDPARLTVSTLLTATRRAGIPRVEVLRHDGEGLGNGREAERRWNQLANLTQLRDSARAARDSVYAGSVRWHLGAAGLVAWQPIIAFNRWGRVTAIAVGAAAGNRFSAAREPAVAWAEVLGEPGAAATAALPGLAVENWRLAREWMARADSALARGDLTAFGRAFEALRALLQATPPK